MGRSGRESRSFTQLSSSTSSLSLSLRLPSSQDSVAVVARESTNNLEEEQEIKSQNDGNKRKPTRKSVKWSTDTVDNEHLNRKKSKVCCIYHPKHSKDCRLNNKQEKEQDKNAYEIQPVFHHQDC